ncbi:TRIC cation channel family protein [Nannocystis pusilla]|uniref:TRIC cation channel family protein n=1 Tax=Nannocystis pusilla TaxID=889268 RepID=UPI003B7FB33A
MVVHPEEFFQLPLYFDLGATLLFGLSGALLAARRGYDPVGLFVVALATGVGGGCCATGCSCSRARRCACRTAAICWWC